MNDIRKDAEKERLKEAYKDELDIKDEIDDILKTAFSNPGEAHDKLFSIYRKEGIIKRIEVNGGALGKVKGAMLGNAIVKPGGSADHAKAKEALSQLAGKVEALVKIEDKIKDMEKRVLPNKASHDRDHDFERDYDGWDRT